MDMDEDNRLFKLTAEKESNCAWCEAHFPREWDYHPYHMCGEDEKNGEGQQDEFMIGMDQFLRIKENGKFLLFKKCTNENSETYYESIE